jgi:hypothetical protein
MMPCGQPSEDQPIQGWSFAGGRAVGLGKAIRNTKSLWTTSKLNCQKRSYKEALCTVLYALRQFIKMPIPI